MRTNTEMRTVNPPPTSRAPTAPLTLSPVACALPNPSAGHRRMAVFIGAWRSDGRSRPSRSELANPVPVRMHGSSVGEWLPGEFFLLHRWEHRVGNVGFGGLWVMGYERKTDAYPLHLFDDAGNAVEYQATVTDHVWRIIGANQRGTISFSDDGRTMTQRWSMRDGESWFPLCDLRAIRSAP